MRDHLNIAMQLLSQNTSKPSALFVNVTLPPLDRIARTPLGSAMIPMGSKLAPFHVFVRRVVFHLGLTLALAAVALSLGVAGYHWIAGFPWVDSILNASMILGGMGEVDPLKTNSAKLFASAYALFAGLVFMVSMGVLVTPLVHRIMHRFHLEERESELQNMDPSPNELRSTEKD